MESKQVVLKALEDYKRITGLRGYALFDNTKIQSASEKSYFCKCLKISSKALQKCNECMEETYTNARTINHECIYSCHAGLIKWALPIKYADFHCVIVSEGILAKKQREEAASWTKYLAEEYDLNEQMLLRNYDCVMTMNEEQMHASIELLKSLMSYYFTIFDKEKVKVSYA